MSDDEIEIRLRVWANVMLASPTAGISLAHWDWADFLGFNFDTVASEIISERYWREIDENGMCPCCAGPCAESSAYCR